MDDYVLKRGFSGASRLRRLARVTWPTTAALLRTAGLKSGMSCLDVGCGIGRVTLRLARAVGPDGSVVGLDADRGFIAQAQRTAARRAVPVTFRARRVEDITDESAYDLVYSRFLLSHLSDPAAALSVLRRAVRPGGVMVVEDIEFSGSFSYPSEPAFARYVQLYREVVRRRGADADIGPRLPGLMKGAGLRDVRLSVVQPTSYNGEDRGMSETTLAGIAEAITTMGLATPAEVDSLLSRLGAFARTPGTIESLPRIYQVWGLR